jgi:hypothetical protein
MTLTSSDHDPDPEAAELRALAEMQGFVRYYEQARELQERERDEAECERDAWEKYEAAMDAKLSAQEKLAGHFVIVLSALVCLAAALVELIRWLT